jgi:SOS-response transcriptional repressor LexA
MTDIEARIARRRNESLGDRIRRKRKQLALTQQQLAKTVNVNQGTLSEIERGRRPPSRNVIKALAIALDLPEAVLIGNSEDHDAPQPLEAEELPLFGRIPAGVPSETQEQLEMFPVLRHLWRADRYCLRLEFDSMEPTLKPDDIVLVQYRPDVNPELVQGKICACLLNNNSTLKRVSVEQRAGERAIILRGDNPTSPPIIVDDTDEFTIQGIVIKLVSRDL